MKGFKALALSLLIDFAWLAVAAHLVHNRVFALTAILQVLDNYLASFSHKSDELLYVWVLLLNLLLDIIVNFL